MALIWKFLRFGLRAIFVLALVFSLTLNFASFVGGALFAGASVAFETVTGKRSLASRHAAEVAELSNDLNAERRATRELRGEVSELSGDLAAERRISRELRSEVADVSDQLVSEKAINRQLRGEVSEYSRDLAEERVVSRRLRAGLNDASGDIVTYRGRRVAISEAVEETADKISSRARKSATREVGSMAGEALPWLGTAVIVGVTTLEIKDLCDTLKDMNELKKAFDPTLEPDDDQITVCAMEVPDKAEVWAAAKASPRLAWEKARSMTPTLEDIRNIDFSSIDWADYQDSIASSLSTASTAVGSAVGGAWDATLEGATGFWDWVIQDEVASTPTTGPR